MSGLFKTILDNSDKIGSYVILLFLVVALGYLVYALAFGKIPSPGDFKRCEKRSTEQAIKLDEAANRLDTARDQLADARVLHARSEVRIEYLEAEIHRKDVEIADLRQRVTRLETRIEVWQAHKEGAD